MKAPRSSPRELVVPNVRSPRPSPSPRVASVTAASKVTPRSSGIPQVATPTSGQTTEASSDVSPNEPEAEANSQDTSSEDDQLSKALDANLEGFEVPSIRFDIVMRSVTNCTVSHDLNLLSLAAVAEDAGANGSSRRFGFECWWANDFHSHECS